MDEEIRRLVGEGQLAAAETRLLTACAAHPEDGSLWLSLASLRHRMERPEAALAAVERGLALEPENLAALQLCAALLLELKRPQAALKACNAVLELDREKPASLYNAALILEELGHVEAALESYQRVIDKQPVFLPALLNRTALLARLQRLDAALAAALEATKACPDSADCWYNLGDAFAARGDISEALDAFERAIGLDPEHVRAILGSAIALSAIGRFEEANAAFALARSLDETQCREFRSPLISDREDPSCALDPRRIHLNFGFQRLVQGDWSEREQFVENLRTLIQGGKEFSSPLADRSLPHAAFSVAIEAELRCKLAGQVAAAVVTEAGRIRKHLHRLPDYKPGRKTRLRIGYVSPDFRRHPTAYLTRRLYALHDRRDFEVFAYSLHPDDGSEVRAEIAGGCDEFLDVSRFDSASLAGRILYDGIDLLVDLAGYTRFARPEVFAARCAALQIGFLGYPGTSGGRFIDYALVDRVVCPPGTEWQWTEKPVYFPQTYFLYDEAASVSASAGERTLNGLPENAFVFCCFNAAWKIAPDIFDIWMRLLARHPDAVLWLYGEDRNLQANLRQEAERRGVRGSRLVFAGERDHAQHLARYRLTNLFLDTQPCGAHTTAADALWMGVPVLTCLGDQMPARVAASQLKAVGLADLITENLKDYEFLASRLAAEPAELAAIKAKLEVNRRSSVLFNTERRTREIETAYSMMWQRHCAGLPPESFAVPPIGE